MLIFILIVLAQGLVVNNIQISVYLNPMIYPIMILMLPFNLNTIVTMSVALLLGLSVDAFSDTFGLHASAAVMIGYLRPSLMKYIQPNEGYDNALLPTVHDMGIIWFLLYSSLLLFVHHLWFFSIEVLRFDLIWLILGKTFLSTIFSLALIVIFQYIFYKPSK